MYGVQLGRLAPTPEQRKRALHLAPFLKAPLPAPPFTLDYTPGVTYRMYGNDRYGCCTIAGLANFHATAAVREGRVVSFTDQDVLDYYLALTGGQDTGLVEHVALDRAVKGFPLTNEHKVAVWVRIDVGNLDAIRSCAALFWAVYVGAELPVAAQGAQVWDTSGVLIGNNAPGGWGGHCLVPGTRVLTSDLRWVPIETLNVGDELVGFDENRTTYRRSFRKSIVLSKATLKLPCVELTMEDGTVLQCSTDHLWFTSNSSEVGQWLRADQLRVGKERRSRITKVVAPWETDSSRNGGYLAGAFDGEGWIDGEQKRAIHALGFCQRDNVMWKNVREMLMARGFCFHESTQRNTGSRLSKCKINNLVLNRKQQLLRFLGSIRPHRLLQKFSADRLGMLQGEHIEVVSRRTIGECEVVALGTSTRTFIAEGFASHNCMICPKFDSLGPTFITWGIKQRATWAWWRCYVDEAYALLDEERAKVANVDWPALVAEAEVLRAA